MANDQSTVPATDTHPSSHRGFALTRGMEAGLAFTGLMYVVVAHLGSRLLATAATVHGLGSDAAGLVQAVAEAGLLFVGFSLIAWIAARQGGMRAVNQMPARPTTGAEWCAGALLGWAMALVAVVPLALVGDLQPGFVWTGAALAGTLVSLLMVAFTTLAAELALRGFIFVHLRRAMGPVRAAVLLSVLAGVASFFLPGQTALGGLVAFALSLLLSVAYLRTHDVWVSWGLHFGWLASIAIFFGLPANGLGYVSVVQSNNLGNLWLTGGGFGPAASLPALAAIVLAVAKLLGMTRDWAWAYTHEMPVGRAYAVVVHPPAAHTAMEAAGAATASSLVQILPSTPAAPSTMDAVNEHLRES